MKTRRSKLVSFPVTAEGIIDLPDGAVLVPSNSKTKVVSALATGHRQRGPKCLLRTTPTHDRWVLRHTGEICADLADRLDDQHVCSPGRCRRDRSTA